MKCPRDNTTLKKVLVQVHGAQQKGVSYQCPKCDYFEFEPSSSARVLEELRDAPLKIRQSIVKLSQNRLGIYFNKHITESLNLRKGESIYVSVPDKRHIVLEIKK